MTEDPRTGGAHLELSGSGRLSAGAEGFIELRGGDVVVHVPAITAVAGAGEVRVTADGVVSAGGRKLPLPGAVSVIVLGDVIRNLLEAAEDPNRRSEVNVAVSLLIAVLLVLLNGQD
jgi:hypothetical protein